MTKEPGLGDKVCSAEHAVILDNKIRRLFQNPDKILAKHIEKGQTVADLGSGPGFFTMAMARLVGENGRVIAVDLQQAMLDKVRSHAIKEGLEPRVRFHKCENDKIGLNETVDFALAFYMVHEVPNAEAFLKEVYGIIKPGGKLLLVEPKFHVSLTDFQKTVELAKKIGFKPIEEPRIILSRSVVLTK